MLQRIKNSLLALSAVFMLATAVAVPVTVSAATIQQNVCSGANDLAISSTDKSGQCAQPDQTNKVNDLLTEIINVFSVIVGVVAVIMIIVGGFRYITSGGASDKVTSAKNTILYAIIGLIIVALSQIIVKFVLSKTVTGQ
jgi:cytochrome bd-type quinol oxidase subunit 2